MAGLPAKPMRLASAGGQCLWHCGRKLVAMQVNDEIVSVCYEVVDVKRPIPSVARLLDKGYTVRFDEESQLEREDGERLILERKGGLFVLQARVLADAEMRAMNGSAAMPVEYEQRDFGKEL